MILSVHFTDGSNPWVSLPADRNTIAKHWRQWKKNHPDTARCVAYNGRYACYQAANGNFVVTNDKKYPTDIRVYKNMYNALISLEKLGSK